MEGTCGVTQRSRRSPVVSVSDDSSILARSTLELEIVEGT